MSLRDIGHKMGLTDREMEQGERLAAQRIRIAELDQRVADLQAEVWKRDGRIAALERAEALLREAYDAGYLKQKYTYNESELEERIEDYFWPTEATEGKGDGSTK